jgi:hypothetical protein
MAGFDIIGDVHGCAFKLEALLKDLGYRLDPWSGVFRHDSRQAIFVGDLIDRGPSQLRVLEVVKGMVDSGSAQIVMGNHEFNALAYDTEDPDKPGKFLRPHGKKNDSQHEAFLNQLTAAQRDHFLAWFRSMPLWLDFGTLRVVHACWHAPSIERIGDRFTTTDQLIEAARRSDAPNSLYRAVENVLKGPELHLRDYGATPFLDKDKHEREDARVRWWRSGATKLAELAEIPSDARRVGGKTYGDLPDVLVSERDRSFSYGDSVPVFYGHYWRSEAPVEHQDWTKYTACVDFSAVNGGTMVAYSWSGEDAIDWRHYHPHGRKVIEHTPSP